MATTSTKRAPHPCNQFVARPGALCAGCGWRRDRHDNGRLTAFGFRASTRRNGGEWVAVVRKGAVIQNHLLRAPGHDRAAAEVEVAELLARLGVVDAR